MSLEREQFLSFVKSYIESDPEAAAYVSDYVQAGLRSALEESNQRAADMETVASVMIYNKRWKGQKELVLSKLSKWKDKAAINWSGVLEYLSNEISKEKK